MHVAFTAFNRPGYLAEALSSWGRVRGAEQAEFCFHVDPSGETESVAGFCGRHGRVTVNQSRLGTQANPYRALECGFERSDFVVLAEDDFVVSEDVLEYLGWAAEEYASDSRVLAVSSTQFEAQGSAEEVLLLAGWTGWVWGTWRDRWENLIRPGWTFGYEDGGWDWHLVRTCQRFGLCTAVPALSRSQHIGQYGGVHTVPGTFADHQSRCYASNLPPQEYRRKEPDEPLRLPCHHEGT